MQSISPVCGSWGGSDQPNSAFIDTYWVHTVYSSCVRGALEERHSSAFMEHAVELTIPIAITYKSLISLDKSSNQSRDPSVHNWSSKPPAPWWCHIVNAKSILVKLKGKGYIDAIQTGGNKFTKIFECLMSSNWQSSRRRTAHGLWDPKSHVLLGELWRSVKWNDRVMDDVHNWLSGGKWWLKGGRLWKTSSRLFLSWAIKELESAR